MTEHPIIFTGPMVRAIIEGKKTQTRRPISPQPEVVHQWDGIYLATNRLLNGCTGLTCRYGKVGDHLWVRETWDCFAGDYSDMKAGIRYKADDSQQYVDCIKWPLKVTLRETPRWRPAIHMPRWASRLTLEITGIRVERVHDISEGDAKAEGVDRQFRTVVMRTDGGPDYHIPLGYRGGFANSWNGIYSKCGLDWDVSPWVWAIEFTKMEAK